jgi:putative addiction module component (TIGR02574 family)
MRLSVEDFDFASLTAAERLRLAQELLDSVFDEVSPSMSARETAAPFSAEQMAEIRRRAADADAGIAVGEPWETVRARLHNR